MIRVLLVDDHKLVRAGLQSLLESTNDLTVVGAASSGEHAVELVDRLTPDVVLMDLSMPGMGGIEATRRITARYPEVQVLVLTSFSDAERVRGALDAGAVGYLLKDSEPEDLLGGLRAVVAGESPLDSRAARAMLSTARPGAEAELTHREREVLTLVSRGLANKDIAHLLTITERTVKAHLSNAFAAIGVADRTSAAMWAQRHLATVD